MERCDCQLRMVRVNYILDFDKSVTTDYSWQDVLLLYGYLTQDELEKNAADTHAALQYLITSSKNVNSVKNLILRARENARGAQDYITKELWEQINANYHVIMNPEMETAISGQDTLKILDDLCNQSMMYSGVYENTMSRGQGWNFMNIGRLLDRCYLTIDTTFTQFKKINHDVNNPQDILFWKHLLLALGGYEQYLKTFTDGVHNKNVINHIIFNGSFPKSLLYCLTRIKRYTRDVIAETRINGSDILNRKIGLLASKVEYTDIDTVINVGLEQYLIDLRKGLNEFSNDLTRIYFSYA